MLLLSDQRFGETTEEIARERKEFRANNAKSKFFFFFRISLLCCNQYTYCSMCHCLVLCSMEKVEKCLLLVMLLMVIRERFSHNVMKHAEPERLVKLQT